MKKRPTVADRRIAEYVRNLPPGNHEVHVYVEGAHHSGMQYMGLARLKTEGMMSIQVGDKYVTFHPKVAR